MNLTGELAVGSWVSTVSGGVQVKGFIKEMSSVLVSVTVTRPNNLRGCSALVGVNSVLAINSELLKDDLSGLVDLALDMRDEAWFYSLTESMGASK